MLQSDIPFAKFTKGRFPTTTKIFRAIALGLFFHRADTSSRRHGPGSHCRDPSGSAATTGLRWQCA